MHIHSKKKFIIFFLLIFSFVLTILILKNYLQDSKINISDKLIFDEKLLFKGSIGDSYLFGISLDDFFNDNKNDIIVADAIKSRVILFNDSSSKGKSTIYDNMWKGWAERHHIADLDADGYKDVVIVENNKSSIYWLKNPKKKNNTWQRKNISKSTEWAYDLTVDDLDNDGDFDVAATTWQGNKLVWFQNLGNQNNPGPWKKFLIDDTMLETREIISDDIDSDGKIDLIMSASKSNSILFYKNLGGGLWKRNIISEEANNVSHGRIIDMDGDGDKDIIMALNHQNKKNAINGKSKNAPVITWYENNLNNNLNTWKEHEIIFFDEGAFEVSVDDFDNDNDLDIVASFQTTGKIIIFENINNLNYNSHKLKDNWPGAGQIITTDFNKDNLIDIVVTSERPTNEVLIFRNSAGSKFFNY